MPEQDAEALVAAFEHATKGSLCDSGLRRVQVAARYLPECISVAQGIGVEVPVPRTNRVSPVGLESMPGVGSELSVAIDGFFQLKAFGVDCSDCQSLTAQLNRMGPVWCVNNSHRIATHMVANLKTLGATVEAQASPALRLAGWAAGQALTRPLMHKAAVWLIERAAAKVQQQMPEPINVPDDWRDPLHVTDYRKEMCGEIFEGTMHGGAGFIIGGGPSFTDEQAKLLSQRGIWSMAINNAACHPLHRPNAMVCADPPNKFHDGIWRDPGIMKFVPIPKLRGGRGSLRAQRGDGTFYKPGMSVVDCPNVWGFLRRNWCEADESFFTDTGAAWGNLAAGVLRTGRAKGVCTLLLAIRLMYWLGFRTIYLVGVDFKMSEQAGYFYPQARDADAVTSNMDLYSVIRDLLAEIKNKGIFEAFGLKVVNCNPESALDIFEHSPIDEAVSWALKEFPQQPWKMQGWYEKKVDEQ